MLTVGIDHVATITKDTDRLQQFYVENFGASIEFDGPEFPGGPRMTIINIGPDCELNVFEIDGNTEADHQTPMYGRGGSTTSGCWRRVWRSSRRSGLG